jgi:hypothetical protein
MITVLLLYSLFLTVFMVGIQIVGIVVLRSFRIDLGKINMLPGAVFEMFIGLLLLVFLIAVYHCGINTVFVVIPLFIGFLFFELKLSSELPSGNVMSRIAELVTGWKYILILFFISMLVVNCSIYYELSTDTENDAIFYSQLCEHIGSLGVENSNLYQEIKGISLYHYFEMWLTVGFSKVFVHTPTIILLKYLTYSFFKSFFVLGIISLVVKKISWKLIWIVPSVLLLTLAPIDQLLNYYNQTHFGIYTNFWYRPNFLTYNFVFIVVILLWQERRWASAITCLLLLPIISITTLPIAIGGVLIFIVAQLYGGNISKKAVVRLLVYSFLLISLLGVLTHFVGQPGSPIYAINMDISVVNLLWTTFVGHLKVVFYVLFHHAARILILVIAVAVLFWKQQKLDRQMIYFMLSVFLIVLFGIVLLVIGMPLFNGYQMAFAGYSLLLVTVVFALSGLLNAKNYWMKLLIFSIALLGFISIPTDDSTQLISQEKFKQRVQSITTESIILHGLHDKKVSNIAAYELERNSSSINKVALFVNERDIDQIAPRHRTITFAFGNELSYLKPGVKYSSVTPANVIYSDIDSVNVTQFTAVKKRNNQLDFYQKKITELADVAKYIKDNKFDTVVLSSENKALESYLMVYKKINDDKTGRIYLLLSS